MPCKRVSVAGSGPEDGLDAQPNHGPIRRGNRGGRPRAKQDNGGIPGRSRWLANSLAKKAADDASKKPKKPSYMNADNHAPPWQPIPQPTTNAQPMPQSMDSIALATSTAPCVGSSQHLPLGSVLPHTNGFVVVGNIATSWLPQWLQDNVMAMKMLAGDASCPMVAPVLGVASPLGMATKPPPPWSQMLLTGVAPPQSVESGSTGDTCCLPSVDAVVSHGVHDKGTCTSSVDGDGAVIKQIFEAFRSDGMDVGGSTTTWPSRKIPSRLSDANDPKHSEGYASGHIVPLNPNGHNLFDVAEDVLDMNNLAQDMEEAMLVLGCDGGASESQHHLSDVGTASPTHMSKHATMVDTYVGDLLVNGLDFVELLTGHGLEVDNTKAAIMVAVGATASKPINAWDGEDMAMHTVVSAHQSADPFVGVDNMLASFGFA